MSALRVLVWAHLLGLVLTVGWVAVTEGEPAVSDLVIGAAAGGFGLGGLYFLYSGLARGRAAVVAPAAAVVGAVLPVLGGILLGERPSALTWAGVAIAVPAILLVSTVQGDSRRSGGIVYGLVAGVFFGLYFLVFAQASAGSGLWPLLGSRLASVAALWVPALTVRSDLRAAPRGSLAMVVVGVGVFDLVANAAFLAATRSGSIVVVAVVASLFPAVTVLAARIVQAERLTAHQLVGLSLGVVAVGLLSIP